MANITIVHSGSGNKHTPHIKALKNGIGWATSTAITYTDRYADDGDTGAAFSAAIAHDNPTLLVAAGGTACAKAAVQPTAANHIPVVFTSIADPVRPASNMTGICARTSQGDIDRLNYLHRALPSRNNFGVRLATFGRARILHNCSFCGMKPPLWV